MAHLPLRDAILIENGVVTRINRIARAIEYTPALASEYKSSGLSHNIIREAEAQGKSHRASTKAKGASPFRGGGAKAYAFGEKRTKIVTVTKAARRAIAAALGVLVAYDRGTQRKRMASAQKVSGSWFGKRKMESRDSRLGRVSNDKSQELARFSTGRSSLSSRLDVAGLTDIQAISLLAGDSGYHAQAFDKAYTLAKAKLRSKYRDMGKAQSPEYYAELARLRGLRVGSAFEVGDDKAFGRVGPKSLRAARAAQRGQAKGRGRKGAGSVAANPFSDVGTLALTNPNTGIGFLDSIEASVSSVPVVGPYVAPLLAPAAIGAAAFGIHLVAVPKLKEYLPEAAQPFAYTIGGCAVGAVAGVVANMSQDETVRNLAGLLGGAAVAVGVGLDLYNKYGAGAGATSGDDEYSGLAMAGDDDDFGAVGMLDNPIALAGESALGAIGYGDGMAYQTAPLGYDGDTNTLQGSYNAASPVDAYYSGPDFDAAEGEAIMAGAGAFGRAAGNVPKRAAGQKQAMSHYAGRPYHRWGWTIRMITFPAMQQVAALSPDERLKVINQLRSQALALVARATEQARAAQLASQPVAQSGEFSAQAPQGAMAGYDMGGYGALVLAGNGY